MKTLLFAFCSLPLLSADLMPLATGNTWTYRVSDGSTRTISVSLPLAANGRTYYRVSGFAAAPLWLRSDANAVYFYHDETSADVELVRFSNGSFNTPVSGCEQAAEARRERDAFQGTVGRFENPLEIRYRPLACRDVGFETETYLDNIGLVRRTETTIAGTRTMELIYAKVGALTIEPGYKTTLSLSLDRPTVAALPGDAFDLKATLRLAVADGGALRLRFPSAQRYDLAIRDANGEIVHSWSADKIFAAVMGEEQIGGQRTWQIDSRVSGLLPGSYQVEAWLTTAGERQLAVTTPLQVMPAN